MQLIFALRKILFTNFNFYNKRFTDTQKAGNFFELLRKRGAYPAGLSAFRSDFD
jgi:hypothetical protein